MATPLSNLPQINPTDIGDGFVVRYFVQNVSTKKIVEVDKAQFRIFNFHAYYQTLDLKWCIGGNDKDVYVSGFMLYGAEYRNTELIKYYNQKMPGLDRLLTNPLQYFNGTRVVV